MVTKISRAFDPVVVVVCAVAVVFGASWSGPPRAGASPLRTAAVTVELQAATAQTALAAVADVVAASEADAAGVEEPVSANPVDLLQGVVTLAATVAGTALWYAAFPVTLPATIVAGIYFTFVFSYFGGVKPDFISNGIAWGVMVFFEFPPAAIKYAFDALQPVQPVSAAAAAGTDPRAADATASIGPARVPTQTAAPVSSVPDGSVSQKALRTPRARAGSHVATAPGSRTSSPRRPAAAQALASPPVAEGVSSGPKADSAPGTARRAARGAR